MSPAPPGGPGPGHRRATGLPHWSWLALPLFVGVLLAGMRAHELWRDETQAWAVARDSVSLTSLLGPSLRYEGHPPLWYLLLYPLTRFTHDPLAMQLMHAALATACVALILARAPFSRLTRVLLAFGYFPLYEWGVLSRNYSVGLLALLVTLALYPRWRERLIPMAAALALLSISNAYGLLVAGALAATLLFAAGRDRAAGAAWPGTAGQRLAAVALLLAGFAVSAAFLIPPADRWSGHGMTPGIRNLCGALAAIWNGWVPLPNFADYHFWNTNVVTFDSWKATILSRAVLGVLLVASGAWLLRRHPVALTFLGLGTAGLVLFTYLRWPGYLRHHGHFFLVFVGALWLAACHSREPLDRRARLLLLGLALVHVAAGGWAVAMDLKYPFSDSRAAARFIRENGLERLPIVGTRDCLVSPLATYLDRLIYYPEYGGWGSAWKARYRERYYDPLFALAAARQMANDRGESVLLVLSRPLPPGHRSPFVNNLATFESSFLRYDSGFARLEPEHFFFYRIEPAGG